MLNLLVGPSGSGKTFTITKLIEKELDTNNEKILLIVPEQFSFTTEKHILKKLGVERANKIQVYSFTRLCDMVFRQTGNIAGDRLDESGRLILTSEAIESTQNNTDILSSNYIDIELVRMLSEMCKEIKHSTISANKLQLIAKEISDDTLKRKIQQIALISEAYDTLVNRGYLDPTDDLTKLDEVLYLYDYFKGYTIYIDCFDGFTVQELKVITHMLRQADEVTVALTADKIQDISDKYTLFAPITKTIKTLSNLAKENNIDVKTQIIKNTGKRYLSEELITLERNMFRENYIVYDRSTKDINIYEADNYYDEAKYVAKTIKRLVMEEEYRYRDFAIIARNIDRYRGVIDALMDKYDIKYFLDIPDRIDERPLMNLALSAFSVVHSGYTTSSLMGLLKTGIAGFTTTEISELENYAFTWNIDKSDWKKEFTHNPEGLRESISQKAKLKLEHLENLRKRIMLPFEQFQKEIQEETATNIAKALYNLMMELNVKTEIEKLSNELEEQNHFDLSNEQIRLWEILITVLDQLVNTIGDKKITSKKFRDLLELTITSKNIAFIPQKNDQVLIGSANRTVLDKPKVIFVIGANEGEFPKDPENTSILSDKDRKKLKKLGLDLHTSLEEEALNEKYLVYKVLAAPSDKLFITYNEAGIDGKAKLPSVIIREIKKVFPKVAENNSKSFNDLDDIYSLKSGFDTLGRNFFCDDELTASLIDVYSKKDKYDTRLGALELSASRHEFAISDSNVAKKLFSEKMRVSASQLEEYYTCSFKYFCRYGIRAKERKKAELDALEYGSLMHYAFEKMLKEYSVIELNAMDYHKKQKLINSRFTEYVESKFGNLSSQSARFRYLFNRTVRTATNLLTHIVDELSQSEFVPYAMEMDIGKDIEPLTLKDINGDTIEVIGKVDRVDVMQNGNTKYVRVIDYKTGTKEFKLSDILYGLNMQMLIYLDTISKSKDEYFFESIPSGILYMPASNKPIIESYSSTKEDIEAKKRKQLQMNGLILSDTDVIKGMEHDAKGIYIPVKLDGENIKKSESLASLSQMGKIAKKVESLIVGMSEELKQGEIPALPVDKGDYKACQWCVYSDVCGHEEDDKCIDVKKMKNTEALKLIEEEATDGKDVD